MKQQSENLQEIKGDEAIASGVWPTSAMNDAGTPARSGTQLTQLRSGPVRYRFTDQDGKSYAPFRLKSGIKLFEIVSHAFPDADDFEVQVVGADQ